MAARYYERNTSGMNFDRFLDRFDESTLLTMKRHYWTAKQVLRSKLGKKEDEHLLASDADLDSKLTLFRSVRDTSENLLACIENYQAYLLDATLVENHLGKYLKDQGKRQQRKETNTVMVAAGRAFVFSSHQRAAVRQPLVRFYQELHVFAERAIADCAQTVDAVERARTQYRGSLLWMKQTSEELDPDTDRQLEKFREAQAAVRSNKERLDKLKVDTLQKVDLLSASRSNLLSHLLGKYLETLVNYYDQTARTYSALASNLSTFQHYEFEILTDLIEPSKKAAKKHRQQSIEKEGAERKEKERKASEEEASGSANLLDFDDEMSNTMKSYLFGRESPDPDEAERLKAWENERTESPLGILEEGTEALADDDLLGPSEAHPSKIGPLAPLKQSSSAEVPRLAPPPIGNFPSSSTAHGPALLSLEDDIPELDSLFPKMPPAKPLLNTTGIMDLLAPSGSSVAFPNPFDESRLPSEWDQLLMQCDAQQHNNGDLL